MRLAAEESNMINIAPEAIEELRFGFVPAPPGCHVAQTREPTPARAAAVAVRTKSVIVIVGLRSS